jgi:membrane protease YdiL (CAAX protease family)
MMLHTPPSRARRGAGVADDPVVANRSGVHSRSTRHRRAVLGIATVAWLGCFVFVRSYGNWLPFAFVGVVMVAFAVATDARVRALLRPSWAQALLGFAVAAAMVLATHGAFTAVSHVLPVAAQSTWRLFQLLDVVGFAPLERASLIVVIAACEEVIVRGALLGPPAHGGLLQGLPRRELLRVLGSAVLYALATATLGSGLLLLTAFCCGVLWGLLRVATRSLVAPIVAHVGWDLGVLVLWPLVFAGA